MWIIYRKITIFNNIIVICKWIKSNPTLYSSVLFQTNCSQILSLQRTAKLTKGTTLRTGWGATQLAPRQGRSWRSRTWSPIQSSRTWSMSFIGATNASRLWRSQTNNFKRSSSLRLVILLSNRLSNYRSNQSTLKPSLVLWRRKYFWILCLLLMVSLMKEKLCKNGSSKMKSARKRVFYYRIRNWSPITRSRAWSNFCRSRTKSHGWNSGKVSRGF